MNLYLLVCINEDMFVNLFNFTMMHGNGMQSTKNKTRIFHGNKIAHK